MDVAEDQGDHEGAGPEVYQAELHRFHHLSLIHKMHLNKQMYGELFVDGEDHEEVDPEVGEEEEVEYFCHRRS